MLRQVKAGISTRHGNEQGKAGLELVLPLLREAEPVRDPLLQAAEEMRSGKVMPMVKQPALQR